MNDLHHSITSLHGGPASKDSETDSADSGFPENAGREDRYTRLAQNRTFRNSPMNPMAAVRITEPGGTFMGRKGIRENQKSWIFSTLPVIPFECPPLPCRYQ